MWNHGRYDSSLATFLHPSDDSCLDSSHTTLCQSLLGRIIASAAIGIPNQTLLIETNQKNWISLMSFAICFNIDWAYLHAMHQIVLERHPIGTSLWPKQRIDANSVWWRMHRDHFDVAPRWRGLEVWNSNLNRLWDIHRNVNTRSKYETEGKKILI